MAKQYDLKDLGEVYGNLGTETAVVSENTESQTVGDKKAEVGDANLEDGGAKEEGGCEEPAVDAAKVEDNPHGVKGELPITKEEEAAPEEDNEEATDDESKEEDEKSDTEDEKSEEDEESSEKALEIAQEGLNNFMANKSVFDRLYAKVMVNENFGEVEEMDNLDALGLDDATPDSELDTDEVDADGEEEVTITLDKATAEKLCDLLKAACGEEEVADEVEGDTEEAPEEDNEGAPTAHTAHVDMGTNNKVGHVDGLGGQAAGSADGGSSADQKALGGSVKDGKANKVGNLPAGKNAFGDVKVEPKNKEVKA